MRYQRYLSAALSVLLLVLIAPLQHSSGQNDTGFLPVAEIGTDEATETLTTIFEGRKIIQLGEAIHITREIPAARHRLAAMLHNELDYQLLLFEGSTVDAWIASDIMITNDTLSQTEAARTARDTGLPPLWHTPKYTALMKHIYATYQTTEPLYVASYDLQPGISSLREDAMSTLLDRMAAYAPAPDGRAKHEEVLRLLSDRKEGFPNKPLPDRTALQKAIDWLDAWTRRAAEAIEDESGHTMHARTLLQIPRQLRNQVKLWIAHQQDENPKTMRAFQETRDELGAEAIQQFQMQVAPGGKVLVWAHHVHVFHNTTGAARHALGTDLKADLGEALYTLGAFAGRGAIYTLNMQEATPHEFDVTDQGIEALLEQATQEDVFIDFASVEDPDLREALQNETTMTVEGVHDIPIVPAEDFHGAIFLHRVTRPEFEPFWQEAPKED